MAQFLAVTVSNSPKVNKELAEVVLTKYYPYMEDGTISLVRSISDDDTLSYHLNIYGYDAFLVGLAEPDDMKSPEYQEWLEWQEDETPPTMSFLSAIQPTLYEDLVIQCIGHEKCRFPLAAWSWFVPAGNGDITFFALPTPLKKSEKDNKNDFDFASSLTLLGSILEQIRFLISQAHIVSSELQFHKEIDPFVEGDATSEWYNNLEDEKFGIHMDALSFLEFIHAYYKDLQEDDAQ